jgi:hypothetical protein
MGKSKLGPRLRCVGLMIVPFTAIQVAPLLEASRPVTRSTTSPWANLGLFATALYVFLSPLVLQRLLRRSQQSREAFERRGMDVDELLLLVGVGTAAAGSMAPVAIMSLGGDSGWFVVPWAVVCFISGTFWCWRYRHVLV